MFPEYPSPEYPLYCVPGISGISVSPEYLIIAIFVFGGFRCSIQGCVGDGWRLEGNKLTFKAWEEHTIIDLSVTRITLADTVVPWQPVRSTYRYGTPGLTAGWFALQNGKKSSDFLSPETVKNACLVL